MVRAITFLLLLPLVSCAAPTGKLTDATEQDRQALQRHLAPLVVEIIDIDRAGSFEARGAELSRVRVVRDVYPARIVLRYQGKTETLSGLPVAGAARYGNHTLRYERALLDDWAERELRRTTQ